MRGQNYMSDSFYILHFSLTHTKPHRTEHTGYTGWNPVTSSVNTCMPLSSSFTLDWKGFSCFITRGLVWLKENVNIALHTTTAKPSLAGGVREDPL